MQNARFTVDSFVHAYRQAPWRVQRQWIGAFLLCVLGAAMIAALYLDVTAQAAIAGRQIQDLAIQMTTVQDASADMQTKLAELTSNESMEKRAADLGFQAVTADQVQYLVVPGYAAPRPALLTIAPSLRPSAPSIPPEYTESLIDWLNLNLRTPPSGSLTGAVP